MCCHTVKYSPHVTGGFILNWATPNMKMLVFLLLIVSVAAIGSLLCSLMIAAFLRRRLISLNSDIKRDFIGKPLLFPARLTHTRRFPETERYNYWYDYFLIGIPVGLRGRVGNLLSIDSLPATGTTLGKMLVHYRSDLLP